MAFIEDGVSGIEGLGAGAECPKGEGRTIGERMKMLVRTCTPREAHGVLFMWSCISWMCLLIRVALVFFSLYTRGWLPVFCFLVSQRFFDPCASVLDVNFLLNGETFLSWLRRAAPTPAYFVFA